jgi:hypothetical protein
MSDDQTEPFFAFDVELSERETFLIGKVVALWGALEYEIFCQTLNTFDIPESGQSALPREMNNMNFSRVLDLWKTRVVSTAEGQRRDVLELTYSKIRRYYDFRNAIAHGMWDWEKDAAHQITATRIRKREIIRTQFTADDLSSFVSELQTINMKVRYPGGDEEYMEDFAKVMTKGYISRRAVSWLSNDPLVKDLFLPPIAVGPNLSNEPPPEDESYPD